MFARAGLRRNTECGDSSINSVRDGLNHVFHYTNLGGKPTKSVFWQSVQHVVNHASYHRGQVTTMLRQLGAQPPDSQDLITFYRL